MNDNQDQDDALVALLRGLPPEEPPNVLLLPRVMRALRAEGLVRTSASRAWFRMAMAVAAALLLFCAGYWSKQQTDPVVERATHVLLLYGAASEDAAEHVIRAREYANWAAAVRSEERVLGGEAIGTTLRVLNASTRASAASPLLPPGEDIVGYFLIAAPTSEAAESLALTCPHLRHGGTVVVREISPT